MAARALISGDLISNSRVAKTLDLFMSAYLASASVGYLCNHLGTEGAWLQPSMRRHPRSSHHSSQSAVVT